MRIYYARKRVMLIAKGLLCKYNFFLVSSLSVFQVLEFILIKHIFFIKAWYDWRLKWIYILYMIGQVYPSLANIHLQTKGLFQTLVNGNCLYYCNRNYLCVFKNKFPLKIYYMSTLLRIQRVITVKPNDDKIFPE